MEIEQKLNILRIIVNLSMKDGIISEGEKSFISQLATSFRLSQDDVKHAIDTQDQAIDIPKAEADRMSILYYMLFALKTDKNIDPNEINYVKSLGFKLGFRSRLVEDMLDTIKASPDNSLPPSALLENIRKYLN